MEEHVELQTAHQPFVSAMSTSSSSSSSSSSGSASVFPPSFSPVWTEPHDKTGVVNRQQHYMIENGEASSTALSAKEIEWLRFIDITANGGMKWKDVEEQFDRLALTRHGVEPTIKSSDFGLCIGEQAYKIIILPLLHVLTFKIV